MKTSLKVRKLIIIAGAIAGSNNYEQYSFRFDKLFSELTKFAKFNQQMTVEEFTSIMTALQQAEIYLGESFLCMKDKSLDRDVPPHLPEQLEIMRKSNSIKD